jgi:signal transduction histidine kinase
MAPIGDHGARIVETADAERCALERDLHDGAQQRLLALSYDIRLARASAEANGDSTTAIALDRAVEETHNTIEELRKLARGIYPAVLTEAGLGPALETLADEAPLPVKIVNADDRRYAATAEAAAYFAVTEVIDSAARRGADHATVSLAEHNRRLIVTINHNGRQSPSPTAVLADRVGALGGNVSATSTECRVEIPCE